MSDERTEVEAILARHGFTNTPEGLDAAMRDAECGHALYAYYCDTMPYGIAKGRTGDPSEWIFQRVASLAE